MGDHGAGLRDLVKRPDPPEHAHDSHVQLPPALVEYADRLLLGTGLDADDALLIASGHLDVPTELSGLANALRTGWQLSDHPG